MENRSFPHITDLSNQSDQTQEDSPQSQKLHLAPVIILFIVCVVGLVGNILIIGSVILFKRIRVRGNAFIVNLAVADLITVAYIMPIGLVASQYEQNPIGAVMCQVNAFLALTSLGVSTQTLMLIALERYFHICKMHIYKKAFTTRLIGLYIVLIWIYTAVWTSQGWTGWTKYRYSRLVYVCLASGGRSYMICLAVFGMLLPMIILGVCYYQIFKAVFRSRKNMSSHRLKTDRGETSQLAKSESEKHILRECRLIITLFTIVVVFVVCWLPACLCLGLSALVRFPRIFWQISIWLAFSNSSLNSIIYGLLNKNFRAGYIYLIRVILCCGPTGIDKSNSESFKKKTDSHSGESGKNDSTRRTRNSKSVSTDSEIVEVTSPGKETDEPATRHHDPSKNYQSTDRAFHGSLHLQPIKYDEEPSSGARVRSQSQSHLSNMSILGADRLPHEQLLPDSMGALSDVSFTHSTSDSQSSLLRLSQPSESGYDNQRHRNQILNVIHAESVRNALKQPQANWAPAESVARPRPSLRGIDSYLVNPNYETKL